MAIVRHIKSSVLYEYLGNDKYVNLATGAEGEVKPEIAQKIFRINLEATQILMEYPLAKELIKRLNLKFDELACVSRQENE